MRGRVLGKSSTMRKNGRLMGEVQAHMCLSTTGGKKAVAMDYFGMLNMYLLKPLMNGDVGKIVNWYIGKRNNRTDGRIWSDER